MQVSYNELQDILKSMLKRSGQSETNAGDHNQNNMIGEYVIVRCRDAGVHAGFLEWRQGRECRLRDSRRLWYWKAANGASFLSGVAAYGVDSSSKIGARVPIILTENCEIILCSSLARDSILKQEDYTS